MFLRHQTDKRQTSICTLSKQYGKRINDNRLGFRFPFDVSMSVTKSPCPCLHVSTSACPCLHVSSLHNPCLHISEFCKRKMATSFCFLQMENGKGKFRFVCCKWKRKMEVVFLGRQTINSNRDSEIFLRISSSLTFAAAFLDDIKLVC